MLFLSSPFRSSSSFSALPFHELDNVTDSIDRLIPTASSVKKEASQRLDPMVQNAQSASTEYQEPRSHPFQFVCVQKTRVNVPVCVLPRFRDVALRALRLENLRAYTYEIER